MGVKDDICNYDYFFGHKWLFGTLCRKEKEKSKSTIYMKNIKRNGMISISLLFPLLVSSLRYGLGTDYSYTYIPQFNSIARGDRGYYEIGFYLLNKIVSFLPTMDSG